MLDWTRGDTVNAIVQTEAQVRVTRVSRFQISCLSTAKIFQHQLLTNTRLRIS